MVARLSMQPADSKGESTNLSTLSDVTKRRASRGRCQC